MANDDFLYDQVAQEISEGHIDRTTWTKAFAHSGGTEEATKSLYIRFRVEFLREQLQEAAKIADQQQRVQMVQTKQKAVAGHSVTCPQCRHIGEPTKEPRGSVLLCLFLCLLYVVPGLIYAACTSGYRYKCSKCGFVFHRDLLNVSN